MDINGFEIDEYNVFKLKDGAKQSTCPKCSHTRKKKKCYKKCIISQISQFCWITKIK